MVFYLLLDWPGDTEYNSSQHDTIINSPRTRTTLVLHTKYNTQRTVLYSVDERDSENTAMHAVSPQLSSLESAVQLMPLQAKSNQDLFRW